MAKFQQKYEQTESNQSRTPEQQLWISVLTKAADDAIYTSDWLESRKAIAWFRSKQKDFKAVCEYAGYNPDYVSFKMKGPSTHEGTERHRQEIKQYKELQVNKTMDGTSLPDGRPGSSPAQFKPTISLKPKKKDLLGSDFKEVPIKLFDYAVKGEALGIFSNLFDENGSSLAYAPAVVDFTRDVYSLYNNINELTDKSLFADGISLYAKNNIRATTSINTPAAPI